LLEVVADSDIAGATATLFRLWNVAYTPDGGHVCDQAAAAGLRCLALENTTLDEICELRVPALIELELPALLDFGAVTRPRGTVLLPGHDPEQLTILESGVKQRFGIVELAQVATGTALLLFRPAVDHAPGALTEGVRDPGVIWLRTVLSEITGEALPTEDPTLFDAAVAAALVTYQQERGLAADGVLSDRTLLRLQVEIGLFDTVADAGAP
jgi:hypothetical protein